MQLTSNNKPIYFEEGFAALLDLIKRKRYSQVFVLTDEHTSEICLPFLREGLGDFHNFSIIETQAGEAHKTIDFCIGIWNTLNDFGADRKSLLINLGGGVVTDMGGFIASTYKRGIDFVNIPTTLLAQADASVGGKTGVDLDEQKNMVGTFAIPQAVFIESVFLDTLPAREMLSGFAELLKHGLIADAGLFNQLSQTGYKNIDPDLVYRSVKIKQNIVAKDPQEQSLRKILNFGHTIGHAFESYSLKHDVKPITHGEAIALGMVCEAYLSHKLNGLSKAELELITKGLTVFYPIKSWDALKWDQIEKALLQDKKNEDGKVLCSLLSAIGSCDFNIEIGMEDVKESFQYYLGVKA